MSYNFKCGTIKSWNEEDGWRWNLEDKGIFTVKSAYLKLERLLLLDDLWRDEEKRVFSSLWKSSAPSKVIAFFWKLFLNRVPTRDNLSLRNVLPVEAPNSCVLCDRDVETDRHLFRHCEMATEVWREVMRWFGSSFLTPPYFFIHWKCWSGSESNKKIWKGLWLVLHTTMWVMWRARVSYRGD
jgi:hypothetical protein